MTISIQDHEILLAAGFCPYEIAEIANAKTPNNQDQPPIDINSPVWQRVLESRRNWIQDKRNRRWEEDEIIGNIMDYYRRDTKRHPLDFIKAEYKPVKKRDFHEGVRARTERMINAEMKGYYKR